MASENPPSPWRSQRLDEYCAHHRPRQADDSLHTEFPHDADDERYFILWRGTHFYARLHQRPYNNGHLLIIPYRAVSGYRELTVAEEQALAELIEHAIDWLREAVQAEGYNVAMNEGNFAESGEPKSLRVHVVPRWSGDTNFMTAVSETKVIPESLEDTYRRLRQVISSGDIDV